METPVTPILLSIRPKGKTSEEFQLGNVEGIDVLDKLVKVLSGLPPINTNAHQDTAYSLSATRGRLDRFMYGVFNLGQYNAKLPIIKITTGEKVGEVQKDESAIGPKFFMGYIPREETTGMFLVERGVRSCLNFALRAYPIRQGFNFFRIQ